MDCAKNNETSSRILIRTILSGATTPIKAAASEHVFVAKRHDSAATRALLRASRGHYNEIVKEIRREAGDNLHEISIFDVYQNAELEQLGKKSVSFHLLFQSSTKTLENKEIEKMLREIVTKIEKIFAAKLRD